MSSFVDIKPREGRTDGQTATAIPITALSRADARQNSVVQYQL